MTLQERPAKLPPALDDKCGRHLTYRDLIHCGKTWHAISGNPETRVENLPQNPDTYQAMRDLCGHILDPVIDHFGSIKLTYGFASKALFDLIQKLHAERGEAANTSETNDQHRSCELNKFGRPYCTHLGMAVDFQVPGRGSREVMEWIKKNTPCYDRIYFYGDDLPFHVSYGPGHRHEPTDYSRNWARRRSGVVRVL